MARATPLPNGYNLDFVQKTGWYIVTDPAGVPETGTFFLEVVSANANGIHGVVQTLHAAGTGITTTRVNYSNSWSAWSELVERVNPTHWSLDYSAITGGANLYVGSPQITATTSGITVGALEIFFHPLILSQPSTITAIGLLVSATDATQEFKVGLYESDKQGMPTNLIAGLNSDELGNLDMGATGFRGHSGLSVDLPPGIYWGAACAEGGSTTGTAHSVSSSAQNGVFEISGTAANNFRGLKDTTRGFVDGFEGAVTQANLSIQRLSNAPAVFMKIAIED